MADYYVDFSASSNGDGSAASPWNQFTSTESANIVPGDRIWFRRVNTDKLIDWVEGTDTTPVYYIGWPRTTDKYYDQRDTSLTDWDNDAVDYCWQKRADTSTQAISLVSNVEVYRINFYNSYNSYNNAGSLRLDTISGVVIENCYINTYSYIYKPYSNNKSHALLYTTQATNIKINKTYFHATQGNTNYSFFFEINSGSELTLSGCTFDGGYATANYYPTYLDEVHEQSTVDNSTVDFIDCAFNIHTNTARSSNIGKYGPGFFYFYSSTIRINGGSYSTPNVNYAPSVTLTKGPMFSLFKTDGSTVTVTNFTANLNDKYASLFLLKAGSIVDITNSTVNLNKASTTLAWVYDLTSLNINSVTGGSITTGKYDERTYTLFVDVQAVDLSKITVTNTDLGPILDYPYRSGTSTVTYNGPQSDLLQNFELYTVKAPTSIENTVLKGLILFNSPDASTTYPINRLGISTLRCTIRNYRPQSPAMTLEPSVTYFLNIMITKTQGNNTKLFDFDPTGTFRYNIIADRNYGFSEFGEVNSEETSTIREVLNSFNNGATKFSDYYRIYETHTAYRNGGAGYSIKLTKRLTTTDEVTYPEFGHDTTWAHIEAAGDYTIKAYFACTPDSTSLTSSNTWCEICTMQTVNGLEQPVYYTSTLSTDGSTWNNIDEAYTAYVLTVPITVDKAQFVSFRFKTTVNSNPVFYIDPKLEII